MMHPIERAIGDALKSGRNLEISDIGTWPELYLAVHEIALSKFTPELIGLLLTHAREEIENPERQELEAAIFLLIDSCIHPLILRTLCDNFWQEFEGQLSNEIERSIFDSFTRKVANRSLVSATRSICLDQAFRYCPRNISFRLRFLASIFEISTTDSPEFLRHAVVVVGVFHSHWPDEALVTFLQTVEGNNKENFTEATVEMGMVHLKRALETNNIAIALVNFDSAKRYLEFAVSENENEHEAKLFLACLSVLSNFEQGLDAGELQKLASQISKEGFFLREAKVDSPPWLGARRTAYAAWSSLVIRLKNLATRLGEPSWYEPALVIEQDLLEAFCASRSILGDHHVGGLEMRIRPRIESALLKERGQLCALKVWIAQNPQSEVYSEANELLQGIEKRQSEIGHPPNPSNAFEVGKNSSAVLQPSHQVSPTLKIAMERLVSMQLKQASPFEEDILEDCCLNYSKIPDYEREGVSEFVDPIALLTIRFLSDRMTMQYKSNNRLAYLFEPKNVSDLPNEDALQIDYYEYMQASLGGTGIQIECTDISSGRADVAFKHGALRFVVEVKKENTNNSIEALFQAYSGQTAEYQNTNIRIGFLLVLDLTEKKFGAAHISENVKTKLLQRISEASARAVTLIRVPGRRLRPSGVTTPKARIPTATTGF